MTEVSQPVVTVPASAIIVFAGVEKVLVVRQGRTAEVRGDDRPPPRRGRRNH